MKTSSRVLALGAAIACGSFSSSICAQAAAVAPVRIEGLQLAGKTADAKASGFRECTPEPGTGYSCRQFGPMKLFGVPVFRATVSLGYPPGTPSDKKGQVPLDALVYNRIYLDVGKTSYDEKCVQKKKTGPYDQPIECRKADQGIDFLEHQLRQAGWIHTTWKMWRKYTHPTQLAQVNWPPDQVTAILEPITKADHDAAVQSVSSELARKAAQRERDEKLKAMMR